MADFTAVATGPLCAGAAELTGNGGAGWAGFDGAIGAVGAVGGAGWDGASKAPTVASTVRS
ncbi:hypothetical protein LXJ57_25425, partial [Escherichia coli]|nr:hypothetical protein [Escherichia coli]